ncbi:M48 family metallopeptidase [Aureibacter tunicatorum]|uniref:Zn-dependent protease with chaperone function n=1 Tax=Aureibacter tunicatorum TaxID=866807 RepID=A0AAE3XP72_9BACT|nr:M48 family metallopeptidase [Aureibacter tunicatorum]MDR6240168.1 Zn-dependent protease with chaperone function [Aureibacter tunicatorum]
MNIFTIGLGVGLASMGVLVLIFLLKFIFKSHKKDRSHLIEVTKAEEPQLFAMIEEIVLKVGTNFPKKVYLSAEVNAAVFYDSSFWSMFFPVQKNLLIGMGLINGISKDELKAILSHEFGHFSQRTMKVGSYVYNVNQVIHNMLYENEGFDNLINKWANASGYFAFFASLAYRIISGIQWLLIQVYEIVNKSFLSLSREMEFQADEIAANVTGIAPLKSSLLRTELIDYSFNEVLTFYERNFSKGLRSENLFEEQSYVLDFLAKENELSIVNNLPEISLEEMNKFNKSKLVIEDQWSSHPSTEQRIERLLSLKFGEQGQSSRLATSVFLNSEKLQNKLTKLLFSQVKFESETKALSLTGFKGEYRKAFLENSFDKLYNGYYDNKNPNLFEMDTVSDVALENTKLEELFSSEVKDKVYVVLALISDMQVIEQVCQKLIPIKSFDYDGIRYTRKTCSALLSTLRLELEKQQNQISENDKAIYSYFLTTEKQNGSEGNLKQMYQEFFEFDRQYDKRMELFNRLTESLSFVNYVLAPDQIKENFLNLEPLEAQFKSDIESLMKEKKIIERIDSEHKEKIDLYLSKKWQYFGVETYFDENIQMLFMVINIYVQLLDNAFFLKKKDLLNYQVSLISVLKEA